MDDFNSRAYNKECQAEYDACMKENDKGIVLNGQATGQKGSATYPTDGEERMTPCPGINDEDEEVQMEKDMKAGT